MTAYAGLAALRLPAAQLEALLADPDTGIALLDKTGRVIRANAAFARIGGPAIGMQALAFLAEPVRSQLAQALAGCEPIAVDGQTAAGIAIHATLSPVRRGAGGVLRLADRSGEQALNRQLAQAQRLQSVGQLAGGIAHDFNNLLTAILGATEDLLNHADPADIDDLTQIRGSAERGAALVRQLLAFGRQQILQPRVVPINDAIQSISTLLQRLLGPRIDLQLRLEQPGRRVRIDPTQLDQVLVNLVVNAAAAMKNGGKLSIATAPLLLLRPLKLGAETIPPGRYCTIEMRDTGAGIPPEILPHIFEPFFTTRQDSGGTGLGLSTVHGIIRQSGGYLAVETEPGLGTCFRIYLSRDETIDTPQTTPTSCTAVIPRSCCVLLVDDEAPVRRLAERALAREGWTVIAACSAEEALELATPILACVVSDVVMPGMDGPALVAQLRRHHPGLPAILVSGYADAELRDGLASDHIRFLAKPFAMRELIDAVKGQGAGDEVLGGSAYTPIASPQAPTLPGNTLSLAT